MAAPHPARWKHRGYENRKWDLAKLNGLGDTSEEPGLERLHGFWHVFPFGVPGPVRPLPGDLVLDCEIFPNTYGDTHVSRKVPKFLGRVVQECIQFG